MYVAKVLFVFCLLCLLDSLETTRIVRGDDLGLKVAQVAWTDGVVNRNHGKLFKVRANRGPLYLWMRVEGSERTLSALSESGQLPIYHQWFRGLGDSYEADEAIIAEQGAPLATDEIPLLVEGQRIAALLGREVTTRGFFDWRTWSGKRRVTRGRWLVHVVYATDEPVLCDGKPCVFRIEVR